MVEARQQRSLDGGRNGEPRQSAVRTASRGFQHGLGYFLDEEWHSVSPRSNLIDDIGGQRQWSGDLPGHLSTGLSLQTVEGNERHMRFEGPRGCELRAEADHD